MVFNSAIFILFYVVVFLLYWSVSPLRHGTTLQNRLLLLGSYVFYGYWDWIFLLLIFTSTLIDYLVGRGLDRRPDTSQRMRRILLSMSVVANLSILGTFKYFDFFIDSFVLMAQSIAPGTFPQGSDSFLLRLALPVGVSFYTFQTISYSVDVYRRTTPAEKNFFDFALFVCFFPQLVAGPIERAGDLLTQLKAKRHFSSENLAKGAWLLLLGFFLKVYVADNLAPIVDQVYLAPHAYHSDPALGAGHGGWQVFFASMAFALQIYGDFAGYSAIALGSAALLGIRLTTNFNTPQFSLNPVDLWRRWHITLNRWLTDYVYISLGGSKVSYFNKLRNIFIVFVLTGLWHGASWTFFLWGVYHGAWLVLYDLSRRYWFVPRAEDREARGVVASLLWQRVSLVGRMALVFFAFAISSVFFRAWDIAHSFALIDSLFTLPWSVASPVDGVWSASRFLTSILQYIWLLMLIDYGTYRAGGNPFWIFRKPLWMRVALYSALFYSIVILGVFGKDVIYFAF